MHIKYIPSENHYISLNYDLICTDGSRKFALIDKIASVAQIDFKEIEE